MFMVKFGFQFDEARPPGRCDFIEFKFYEDSVRSAPLAALS